MKLISNYISKIDELERHFINEDFEDELSYSILEGEIPVVISAPHSVSQTRRGNIKVAESRTGSIANLLYEKTNCFCAFKTHNFCDDANFDEINPYKTALADCIKKHNIKQLIDLHIMRAEHENLIEIGTGRGKNINNNFAIIDKMIQIFNANHIKDICVDKKFSAGNPNTVSSTIARECNIPAVQIEINWRLLDDAKSIISLLRVVKSLKQITLELR